MQRVPEQYVPSLPATFAVGGNLKWSADTDQVFCSPPEGAICLTCGTHLQLGDYGANRPAAGLPRKNKKKKRDRIDGVGEGGNTPTPSRTPVPGGTPGPS